MGDDDRRDSNSVSRRTMLKRMGIAGAVAWVTPVVTSLNTPAFAASGPTSNCSQGGTCASGFVQCGAVGTDCFCFTTPTGAGCGAVAFCAELDACGPNLDCPPGFICEIDSCCETPVCGPICVSGRAGVRGSVGAGATNAHRA